jgi:thiol:disulfide interchange protein DsbD
MRFLFLIFFSIALFGVGFLQPDQAFKPKIAAIDENTIAVEIELGEQIYLYKDKLKIEDGDPEDGINFTAIDTATKTVDHEGDKVYETNPVTHIDLSESKDLAGEQKIHVKLSYQGCSSAGLCYEPQEAVLEIMVDADKLSAANPAHLNASALIEPKKEIVPSKNGSETDQIASVIQGGSLWFILISFFNKNFTSYY